MTYTPTIWQDGVTPVNAANLNKLEQGLAAAVGIPADVVVTPATAHLIRNRFGAADTQPAFRLDADGRMQWGAGGAAAPDVNLWRSAGSGGGLNLDSWFWTQGFLGTEGPIYKQAVAPTDIALEYYLEPWPGADHFKMLVNGTMWWGQGNLPLDTWLARGTPHQLTTENLMLSDGTLDINTKVAATNLILGTWLDTEAAYRFTVDGNGRMEWGPGGAGATDVVMYRSGAGTLYVGGSLGVSGAIYPAGTLSLGAASYIYDGAKPLGYATIISRAAGDADNRFTLSNDGHMYFGGGAAGADTQVYRSAANELKVEGRLKATMSVWANTGAATQVVIGEVGANAGIYFGSAADTSFYRSAAGILSTGSKITANHFQSIGSDTGQVAFQTSSLPADGSGWLLISQQVGDAHWRFLMNSGGYMTFGGGAAPGDTTLYRAGASALKTDGAFQSGGELSSGAGSEIVVAKGSAGQIKLGPNAGSPAIWFGSASAEYIYRPTPANLETNAFFKAAGIKFPDATVQTTAAVGTMVLIQEITLGADGVIDFTGIPATFKHLRIEGMVRGSDTSQKGDFLRLRFNNDTGGGSYQYAGDLGSGLDNRIEVARITGAHTNMNGAGNSRFVVEIPYYAAASGSPGAIGTYTARINDSGSGDVSWGMGTGVWLGGSNVAVNRITLLASFGSGNLKAGSKVALYGIN